MRLVGGVGVVLFAFTGCEVDGPGATEAPQWADTGGASSVAWRSDEADDEDHGNPHECTFAFPAVNLCDLDRHPYTHCKEKVFEDGPFFIETVDRLHCDFLSVCGGGEGHLDALRICAPGGTPGVVTPCGVTGPNGCAAKAEYPVGVPTICYQVVDCDPKKG